MPDKHIGILIAAGFTGAKRLICQFEGKSLETRHQETLQGAGLLCPKLLLEVWSSGESGSFTVIVTKRNGKSCVVAFGQNWFASDHKPEGETAG